MHQSDPYTELSLHDARERFLVLNNFPTDGGYSDRWFMVKIGAFMLPLYSFAWRKRAVRTHDIHHIITGFPLTPAGEIQIATWELTAGISPHWIAAMVNLPTILLGLLFLPQRTFSAFLLGRHSTTLYRCELSERLLKLSVRELRKKHLPNGVLKPTVKDYLVFAGMVSLAAVLASIPIVFVLILIHAIN